MLSSPIRATIRAVLLVAAAGGLWWSFGSLRAERYAVPLQPLAERMLAGERFPPETIQRIVAAVQPVEQQQTCDRAHNFAAIIRFHVVLLAVSAGSRGGTDLAAAAAAADQDLRAALACSPSQAYAWLALALLESGLGKAPTVYLPDLAMSYRVGPHEGWISWRRSGFAFAHLASLDPETRGRVQQEFELMSRDAPERAASVFLAAGEDVRKRLLGLLSDAPLPQRTAIARLLLAKDVDISLPGVEIDDGK